MALPNPRPGSLSDRVEWAGILRTIRTPGILFGLAMLVVLGVIGAMLASSLESQHKFPLVAMSLGIELVIVIIFAGITWFKPNNLVLTNTEYQARFDKIYGAGGNPRRYSIPEIEALPLEPPPKQLPSAQDDADGKEESER